MENGAIQQPRASQLWQWPALLLSLSLMGVSAYLFYGTLPRPRWAEQLQSARDLVSANHPESAIDYLNRVLASRELSPREEADAHLLLAEAIDNAQRHAGVSVADNHARIIQQSQLALDNGVPATSEIHSRMARAFLGLNRTKQALDEFRKAATLGNSAPLQRQIIDLELALRETDKAAKSLATYLGMSSLSPDQRAIAIDQQTQIMLDAEQYEEARGILQTSLSVTTSPTLLGGLRYHLGQALLGLNRPDEAAPHLRAARDLLGVKSPLDAEAAILLGHIEQSHGRYAVAIEIYQDVLTSHVGHATNIPARLGRGVCRVMLGQDEAGLNDIEHATRQIADRKEAVHLIPESTRMLHEAEDRLATHENFQGALEVMSCEQQLNEQPAAPFFARLAALYEQRADQISATLPNALESERLKRVPQVQELRSRAGDAYIAYSRALTIKDDKGYGEALWRGIDLYDQAGEIPRAIAALELFIAERPQDPVAPDAVLRLGRTYFAAGLFDKAIATFQKCQLLYPKSLAASKSAIPLALAYIAKGPDAYLSAERVLLAVVNDNPLVAPDAEEFREAIFELGQLYYRTGRYDEAIIRLHEWTQRYGTERRLGQVSFLTADSYRKSAPAIAGATTQPAIVDAHTAEVRRDRLQRAHDYYDLCVEFFRQTAPANDVEQLYARLASFYRADCLYDLGRYEDAIRDYDLAAFKYQDDPSALIAYIQIVNSYCALGRFDDARAANERARWILRRMPPEAFKSASFILSRPYWEKWMSWSGESGLWKQEKQSQ